MAGTMIQVTEILKIVLWITTHDFGDVQCTICLFSLLECV